MSRDAQNKTRSRRTTTTQQPGLFSKRQDFEYFSLGRRNGKWRSSLIYLVFLARVAFPGSDVVLRPWAIRICLRLPSAWRAYGGLLSSAQGLPAGAWSDRLSPTPALSRHALHRLRDLAGMHDMNALDDWFGLCCAGTPAQNARSRDRARRGPLRPHRRRPRRRQSRARGRWPPGSWRPRLRLDGGAALSQRPVPGQAARHCPALPQGGRGRALRRPLDRLAGRHAATPGIPRRPARRRCRAPQPRISRPGPKRQPTPDRYPDYCLYAVVICVGRLAAFHAARPPRYQWRFS